MNRLKVILIAGVITLFHCQYGLTGAEVKKNRLSDVVGN
jgi:hypothetical protein